MADKTDVREQGLTLMPKFDENGLVTAVVTDVDGGAILMVAHMNEEALRATLDTGNAHFWSRSRKRIWMKGEESGNTLAVSDIFVDCDQDALWIKARLAGQGVACHTGRYSCFYRRVEISRGETGEAVKLTPAEHT